jgi:LmbE family N-acetylglucosaminyl deacetylase
VSTLLLNRSEPERVLVVAAHPDDVDFGVAGTVAAWTDAGLTVAYRIATSGDAGGFDDTPRHLMPEIRQAEQKAAAAAVGVKDVAFLGYPDGRVQVSLELRRDIAREIRLLRPDRVVLPSPERNWSRLPASHPDHMAVGEATLCAVYPDARNPFAFPELADLPPWSVPEVWVMASPHSDIYVDITETFERKLAALRAHVSQTARLPDLAGMMRDRARAVAQAGGLGEGRLAEAFQVVPIPV